jgi:hypothetical protein
MLPATLAYFAPAPLTQAPPGAHRLIRALRIAALAKSSGVDPQSRIGELLGGAEPTRAFGLLLAAMGQAWPDPLVVFRPCCQRLTHDEAALLAMLHHVRNGDRPAFDALLADLIGSDARDYLYCASVRLATAMP